MKSTIRIATGSGLVTALLLLSFYFGSFAAPTRAGQAKDESFFRIQRFYLPPDKLQTLLKNQSGSPFHKLSLTEFETRLRKARAALKKSNQVPRLLQARYRARLAGTALLGNGDWSLHHNGSGDAFLPLDDLGLALRNTKLRNKPAVVGSFGERQMGLLAPGRGRHVVFFDWSLRSRSSNEELYFDFESPASAAASLELTLPEDYTVTVSTSGVLLSGPHFSGKSGNSLWRLRFSGKSKISFVLHRVRGAGARPPLLLAQVDSEQELFGDRLIAKHSFHVEVLHNVVRELRFAWDGNLQPFDVRRPGIELKGWHIQKVATKKEDGAKRILVVQFHEPARGAVEIQIRAKATLPGESRWTSPRIWLLDSMLRTESLKLITHPEVRLENWNAGTFRIKSLAATPVGQKTIQLENRGLTPMHRPSADINTVRSLVSASSSSWWQVSRQGSSLTCTSDFQVRRGMVHHLEVLLPKDWRKGWRIESVATERKNLLRGWVVLSAKNRRVLFLELVRGLARNEQLRLSLVLRSPHGSGVARRGTAIDIPEVVPVVNDHFRGTLGVSVDPLYKARIIAASSPLEPAPQRAPWNASLPRFYFSFRDRAVYGKIHLVPQSSTFRAAWNSVVSADKVVTQFELEPLSGGVPFVDIRFTAPGKVLWQPNKSGDSFHARRLTEDEHAIPLLGLGAGNALAALMLQTALPRVQCWRLTFVRPLESRTSFTVHVRPEPSAGNRSQRKKGVWNVPLPLFPGALRVKGRLSVAALARRTYDSSARLPHSPWPQFWLEKRAAPVVLGHPLHVCDLAALTTFVRGRGDLVHHFRFHLKDWRKTSVRVELPDDTSFIGARTMDMWIRDLVGVRAQSANHIDIPCSPLLQSQWFELVYSSKRPDRGWQIGERLRAPVPRLPIAPLVVRRIWRIESSLVPLNPAKLQTCAARPDDSSRNLSTTLAGLWHADRALARWFADVNELPAQVRSSAYDSLLAAEARFRQRQGNAAWKLADALLRLDLNRAPQAPVLVIDTQALRAGGFVPNSLVAVSAAPDKASRPPFWESLRLKAIPFPSGVLLTTAAEWMLVNKGLSSLPRRAALDDAIGRAHRFGQDKSGRLQSILTWSAYGKNQPDALNSGPRIPLASRETDWVTWQPAPGSAATDSLTVVSTSYLSSLAIGIVVFLVIPIWLAVRPLSDRWCMRIILFIAIGCIAYLQWAPQPLRILCWLPAISVIVTMFAGMMRRRFRARTPSEKSGQSGFVTAAVFVLFLGAALLFAVEAAAQPERGFTVYLLSPPTTPAKMQNVLAPRRLLQRLQRLSEPKNARTGEALLVRATYGKGKVKGRFVEFDAEYRVYCRAQKTLLHLPLKNVQIRGRVLLEGAPALLMPDSKRNGYLLSIQGRKDKFVHLNVPIRVPIRSTNSRREIDFAIPTLLQQEVSLELPKGAHSVQCMTGQGPQSIVQRKESIALNAQLGQAHSTLQGSKIHVRWHVRSTSGTTKPVLESTEYHLWKWQPPASSLTSLVHFRVKRGEVTVLRLRLPPGTRVTSIELERPVGQPVAAPVRLKSWHVRGQDSKRELWAELSAPAHHDVVLRIGSVSSVPSIAGKSSLHLPTPLDAKPMKGFIAFGSIRGRYLDRATHLSYLSISADEFLKEWRSLGMASSQKALRAYQFRRPNTAGTAAVHVVEPPTQRVARQELHWHFHRSHVDLRAELKVSAEEKDIHLVEWVVPPQLTIAAVTATELSDWCVTSKRGNSLLQVWLRGPQDQSSIKVFGWVAAKRKRNGQWQWPAPFRRKAGRFAIPAFHLRSSKSCRTILRFSAQRGLHVTPLGGKGVRLVKGAADFSFAGSQRDFSATVAVRRVPVKPIISHMLQVAAEGKNIRFSTHLHALMPLGDLRRLTVSAEIRRGWQFNLDAPRSVKVVRKAIGKKISWSVAYPPNIQQNTNLTLTGFTPIGRQTRLVLPAINVAPAQLGERHLSLFGDRLSVARTPGVRRVSEAPKFPFRPKAPGQSGGRIWRIQAGAKTPPILVKPEHKQAGPSILAAEHSVMAIDKGRWLHHGRYVIALPEKATSVTITLPIGAKVRTASVDGLTIGLFPIGPRAVKIPFSGDAAVRTLSLFWQSAAHDAALSRPDLSSPRFLGAKAYPQIWTAYIPEGFSSRTNSSSSTSSTPLNVAAADLTRATMFFRVIEFLVDQKEKSSPANWKASILSAQRAFHWYCRKAEAHLSRGLRKSEVPVAAESNLTASLKELRERNERLCKKHSLTGLLQQADRRPGLARAWRPVALNSKSLAHPVSWVGSAAQPPPQIRITPVWEDQQRQLWLMTRLLVVALVLGWILCSIPGVISIIWWTWPEQILALGLVGTLTFGVSALGVALLCAGPAARALLVCAYLRRRRLA